METQKISMNPMTMQPIKIICADFAIINDWTNGTRNEKKAWSVPTIMKKRSVTNFRN
jgi:hypothetical protein